MIDNWSRSEFFDAFKRTCTPGTKTAMLYKKEWFFPLFVNILKITKQPQLLKDRYMLEPQGFFLPPRCHFLFSNFDRKLQQYIEADLINYNARIPDEFYGNPKRYAEHKEPFAVLTLGELEAGFVVCIVPFILSILVFGLEWLLTLKNLVIALIICKNYFKSKDSEQKIRSELMKSKVAAWQAYKSSLTIKNINKLKTNIEDIKD